MLARFGVNEKEGDHFQLMFLKRARRMTLRMFR